jgi:malyl-CoA/(S)-citramalyl-CoA lyase
MLVTQIETAKGFKKRIGFELIIETALGMQNIHAIAGASKRNESLHFGVADYSASTRARTTNIGGANPNYTILSDKDDAGERTLHWGDMWHYALARMVVAARANGLRPIDGPFGDFSDAEGYKAAARRAAVLGCDGKWAIHPSQVALGNEVFTPSAAEVERARRILAAMEQAKREGRGAVALDGRLLDIASIRQAEALVKTAEAIAPAR